MSELAGMSLNYLVDSNEIVFDENALTVVGYNYAKVPPRGSLAVKYATVYDNKRTGNYGPYLIQDYLPDPKGSGFWRNLHDQLEKIQSRGYKLVTWDGFALIQLDEFVLRRTIDLSLIYKIGVLLKDVMTPLSLIEHVNTYGVIIENANPSELNELRVSAHKPDLPIWFITKQMARAQELSNEAVNYHNIGVSYSPTDYWDASVEILKPVVKESV